MVLKKKSETPKDLKEDIKEKSRSAEILGVFTKHNFYVNGFTPEEMRTTLEDLGPTYVKIGQIMSSRTDMLPEAYCKELEKLRSTVQPLSASVARSVIEEETGKRIDEIYAEFRNEPLGSASIAQAHYGVLKDGTKVVTKVQRPKIAEMMRSDFVLLKKLAAMVGAANGGENSGTVDLREVVRELEKVTEEELDFRVEAGYTRQFKELCIEDESVISCPTIIDELTTQKILTMTFVDGYSLSKRDRVEADGYDRVAIGRAILENYLHQVLDVGTFHGDPHQGNIMLSYGVPYWIDFGMIGHVSEHNINCIQSIILALLQKDVEAVTDAALSIGVVKGKLNKSKLMDDVDALMGRYNSLKNLNVGALMSDLTSVMSAHSISMPGEYTMLIRSIVTMQGVLSTFCPELDFFELLTQKMIQRIKDNFDIQEKLTSAVEAIAAKGMQTVKLPGLAFEVLRNLVKGRLKLNLELTGYEEMMASLNATVREVLMAIFACVLFSGSCTLCTTNIQPQFNGVPLAAMIGFVISIALAIFTLGDIVKKKK